PRLERLRAPQFGDRGEEVGLHRHEAAERLLGAADLARPVVPREAGRQLGQLRPRHRVVGLVRVATVHPSQWAAAILLSSATVRAARAAEPPASSSSPSPARPARSSSRAMCAAYCSRNSAYWSSR